MKAVLVPLAVVALAAFVGIYIINTVKLFVQTRRENKKATSAEKAESDGKDEK